MRISRKQLQPRRLFMLGFAALVVWNARPGGASLWLGLALVAAGEALRLWATGYLHKTESLTVAGPYGYLRHPLYLGTLAIASGFALMANSTPAWLLYAGFLLGYFAYYLPYKNRIEGARLEAHFGDEYRRYAVAVPRLLPRLHAYVPLGAGPQPRWQRLRFADNHEVGVALAVLAGIAAIALRWLSL